VSLRIWDGKSAGEAEAPKVTRRSFLRTSTAVAGGLAAMAAALSPLKDLKVGEEFSVQKFLQKHYKEMTAQGQMERRWTGSAIEVELRYKVRPTSRCQAEWKASSSPTR
jgi:hypothetical protein